MADDDYVKRADFERAIRNSNLSDLELRDLVLQLAGQVVALTEALGVEDAVNLALAPTVAKIRASDDGGSRVAFDGGEDKYEATPVDIPCGELIPLCHARCCSFTFALSTQDLDEGVIRFDYGQPYMIRQRSSDGYCVHNDATTRGCTAHAHRPRTCRTYDCRDDKRVWIDYTQRIPAPLGTRNDQSLPTPSGGGSETPDNDDPPKKFDLYERARQRGLTIWRERMALDGAYADGKPKIR